MAKEYVTVGEFDVYIKKMPLESGIQKLESEGLELISAKEYAELILLNPNAKPAKHRTYTSEGYVYYPNGDVVILKGKLNPLIRHVNAAAIDHEEGRRFFLYPIDREKYTSNEQYKEAFDKKASNYAKTIRKRAHTDLEKALEEGALYVPYDELPIKFKLNRFADYSIIRFLYEEYAKPLGNLMKKRGGSVLHFTLGPDQVETVLNKNKIKLPFCQPVHIEKPSLGMHIAAGNTTVIDEYSHIMGVTSSNKKTFVKLKPVSDNLELEIPPDD